MKLQQAFDTAGAEKDQQWRLPFRLVSLQDEPRAGSQADFFTTVSFQKNGTAESRLLYVEWITLCRYLLLAGSWTLRQLVTEKNIELSIETGARQQIS